VSTPSGSPVQVVAKGEEWAEARITLPAGAKEIDALQFATAPGGVLWLDDLLLYD
jgi:hypothetical protein